jgi:hypothetical protein
MAALFWWSDSRVATMKANEWGDFFAGVFAPLAFLWLVLGYLQQGEELRLSTEALRLQADELRNSVEQQRDLVEVSRQQVAAEREALDYERQERILRARPALVVTASGGSFSGGGKCTYGFTVTNTGNVAMALVVDVVPPLQPPRRLLNVPIFERGQQQRLELEQPGPLQSPGAQLTMVFRDTLGNEYGETYCLERESEDPRSLLRCWRVEA